MLNRTNAHGAIFEKDGHYKASELVLGEAVDRTDTQLLAYGHERWTDCLVRRWGLRSTLRLRVCPKQKNGS